MKAVKEPTVTLPLWQFDEMRGIHDEETKRNIRKAIRVDKGILEINLERLCEF